MRCILGWFSNGFEGVPMFSGHFLAAFPSPSGLIHPFLFLFLFLKMFCKDIHMQAIYTCIQSKIQTFKLKSKSWETFQSRHSSDMRTLKQNLSCHQSPLLHSVQEAIIQIMKMRKRISNAQLQTELVEILKNMFLPQKKMIKEQIEWLIEQKYIKRDETDINTFIYVA